MHIIKSTEVAALLPWDALLGALRDMYANPSEVPERLHYTTVPNAERPSIMLLMPAWNKHFFGLKSVAVHPRNNEIGKPALVATYLLSSNETGQPLALIDGDQLTARRTAAASALASDFLARKDARRLLVLGAGRIARLLPYAHLAVRELDQVKVWNHNAQRAGDLVLQLQRDGIDASVAADLQEAVEWADVVSAATLSTVPLIEGDWIRPGTHVDLVGAFTPAMRESDDALLGKASLFVDTPAALHEAGDLVQPLANGTLRGENVLATLRELCTSTHPGRRSDTEITVFKSVGYALEDLVAATLVYRQWQQASIDL